MHPSNFVVVAACCCAVPVRVCTLHTHTVHAQSDFCNTLLRRSSKPTCKSDRAEISGPSICPTGTLAVESWRRALVLGAWCLVLRPFPRSRLPPPRPPAPAVVVVVLLLRASGAIKTAWSRCALQYFQSTVRSLFSDTLYKNIQNKQTHTFCFGCIVFVSSLYFTCIIFKL